MQSATFAFSSKGSGHHVASVISTDNGGQMVLLGECRGVHFTFVSSLIECLYWFPWSLLLAVLGCRFALNECLCGLLVAFLSCTGSPSCLSECVSGLFVSVVSFLLV